MKILLINPCCSEDAGRDLYSANLIGPLLTMQPGKKMALGVPLALPTLAAYTPVEHQVTIVDEEIESIDFEAEVDLVGLTAMTFKASRAYEIARKFRARGVLTVMGGIHATVRPDEALQHCDSVAIGEAEEVWPEILADAAAGTLKKKYSAPLPVLDNAKTPRYELVKNDHYLYTYLQTTRGCPFDCEFCSVTTVSGRKIRKKNVEQILSEVEAVVNLPDVGTPLHFIDRKTGVKLHYVRNIAFIDDNFAIDRKHALAMCAALREYQLSRGVIIPWYTQVNVEIGFDEELLRAMEDAYCTHLFIGFESLDPDTLAAMKKNINSPIKYADAIRKIQSHGIRVIYSTIIGDENTDAKSIDYLESFLIDNNVFHVLLNILTPYPGTALFRKMEEQQRIVTYEPQRYNIRNVVFKPAKMTVEELYESYRGLCNKIFVFDSMFKRGKVLLGTSNRLVFPVLTRFVIVVALLATCVQLVFKSQMKMSIALRFFVYAPIRVLYYGSLYSMESLIASADFDDFVDSENRLRIRRQL